MKNYILIVIAIFLDLLIGDPVTSIHPVRIIGNLILKIETLLYNSNISKRITGLIGVISSLGIVIIIFSILYNLTHFIPFGKEVFSILIYYSTIAIKDLAVHGIRVKTALFNHDIILARKNVGMILSRDTEELTPDKIIAGTVESMSENSSDSIIAPIFWGLLFGPAGALSYRVINTMDAMWGYKNQRFINFGKTAALLDDVVNYLPARITGVLICLVSGLKTGNPKPTAWQIMIRDHSKTASPNAGYPEAAMAGALGIQLGGKASYFGKIIDKPVIGDKNRDPSTQDISESLKIIMGALIFFLSGAALITLVI